ncbi:NAD(P)-binding protein [Mytilinidion resinicola]|uniref:NAD(P)-binding protein n=1 Tax=Mytilinidion resinicola TaxID=574789 RepID=A0A6A6YDB0_9PEZI|nr:NAD(P)-binding protein [Mytilinidion resinicola]KAF2805984.1 NAD(P)-binding protein [Mytilinidion resinicola]
MSPRIFITGVTGYIGGHLLRPLLEAHPEYEIAALVRNEAQAQAVKAAYPAVQTVLGDLDNDQVLQLEASKADVVLNLASADHIAGAVSLIKGIAGSQKNAKFVHISGTGILGDTSTGAGNKSEKVYNDLSSTDIGEILSFDLTHIHRDVEEAVISAAKEHGVTAAIISPPMIYGVGAGPVKKRSIQVPVLIENVLKRGKGFQVLEGNNIWNSVHIDDLASAIILLTEEALKGLESKAAWLPGGYYFTENNEFRWGDISEAVAKIAYGKGLINSAEVDKMSPDKVTEMHPWGTILWGTNSRGSAERLRALGWKTSGKSIADSLPAMVDFEAAANEGQRQKLTFADK